MQIISNYGWNKSNCFFTGEGNLEITISARGRNIPTQVHPLGSARFAVSFVPMEGVDHTINITFNKDLVPGAPFTAKIHTGKGW